VDITCVSILPLLSIGMDLRTDNSSFCASRLIANILRTEGADHYLVSLYVSVERIAKLIAKEMRVF
jgi:hypothetical protein